jgi:hypothetical protein
VSAPGLEWRDDLLAAALARQSEAEPVVIITDDMSTLEVALALAKAGIYVFPVDHPGLPQCAGVGRGHNPKRVRSVESIPASPGVKMRPQTRRRSQPGSRAHHATSESIAADRAWSSSMRTDSGSSNATQPSTESRFRPPWW